MSRVWKIGLLALLAMSGSIFTLSPAHAALYNFSSHTFNNCGNIGVNGPTLANCTSAYSSASWTSSTSNFNTSTGIQLWTVPVTANYTIKGVGAAGGKAGYAGGKGASLQGSFNLTQGDVIKILVGQFGDSSTAIASQSGSGGGGGGTFIYNNTSSTLLIAAGGGGGSGQFASGRDATITETGTAGNTGANPGTLTGGTVSVASYSGGGGGGWGVSSSGAANQYGGLPGGGGAGFRGSGGGSANGATLAAGFLSGGAGAYSTNASWCSQTSFYGGFGGGGHGTTYPSNNTYGVGGGGGGGYSGGGGGDGLGIGGGGGGGGSFNSGTSQSNATGVGGAHGYVIITLNLNPSSVSLSLENGATNVTYRSPTTARIKANTADDGKVSFYSNGKVMPGCKRVSTLSKVAYCSWKPSVHGVTYITAVLESPTGSFITTKSATFSVGVERRTNSR